MHERSAFLLLTSTNYFDVYKSISACTFVDAFNKLHCIASRGDIR